MIDATHPYAASITKSIARRLRSETGSSTGGCCRGASEAPEDAVFVRESPTKPIRFLRPAQRGNILLTTGSKELSKLCRYRRTLPTRCLGARAAAAGFAGGLPARRAQPVAYFCPAGAVLRGRWTTAMLHSDAARAGSSPRTAARPAAFEEKAAARQARRGASARHRPPAQETGSSLPETIGDPVRPLRLSSRPQVYSRWHRPRQRGRADRRGPRGDPSVRTALIGARRMLEAVARPGQLALRRHRAGGDRRSASATHPQCRRFTVVMSGRHRLFQRHEEAPAAAAGLRSRRVLPGLSSHELSLRAASAAAMSPLCPSASTAGSHDIVPAVRAQQETVFVPRRRPRAAWPPLCARLAGRRPWRRSASASASG